MNQNDITPLNIRIIVSICSFAGKSTYGNNASNSPGPGAYNMKSAIGNEGSRVIICGRPQTAGNSAAYVPGPGTYLPTDIKSKAPAYRLGTEQRGKIDKEARLIPGPGSYEPMDKATRGTAPGWG